MSYERIDAEVLAQRLSAARKTAKLTQEAAADHLGLSRPTFIAIEQGTRRPRPKELVKLAQLYQEPLNKLLRDEQRPTSLQPHLQSLLEASANGQEEIEKATSRLLSLIDDYRHLESLAGERPTATFPPQQDLDSVNPYPLRYKLLAVQAFNAEKLSEGELARLLRCSRIRAREIVEEYSQATDHADGAGAGQPIKLGLPSCR